jgi:hypothetical protein
MPRKLIIALLAAALSAVALATLAPGAGASKTQFQIFEADVPITTDPAGALADFRALGANTVRIFVHWSQIAPLIRPPGFNAADPSSYPAANWALLDTQVKDAVDDGFTVDLTIAGGAPYWAQGKNIPAQGLADRNFAWKPDATQYGRFVQAVGKRFSGSFKPDGASSSLPRVHFWALWNEPNFGQDLGPQAIKGSTVSVGPMMYRGLVDSGWKALHQSGHAHDTILIGGFAAQGRSGPANAKHPQGLPGDYAQTKPLLFISTLYCLGTNNKPLRGGAAKARGCPTTSAGTRAFRGQHPGLFSASGVADHPYSGNRSPVNGKGLDKNFAIFPQLGNFEKALDRAQAVYGSHAHLPIYSDEYGYITHPPQTAAYASPATASYYMNWAEYLSWRSPRIRSYAQYLLKDPPHGFPIGFTSGLETDLGKPKATYYAYRMPVYMPKTTVKKGVGAEVWGSARPAHFMARDGDGSQTVRIQFQAGGHGSYTTVRTLPANSNNNYFDVRVPFTKAGNLRLAYTYPKTDPLLQLGYAGTTAYSRIVKVSIAR